MTVKTLIKGKGSFVPVIKSDLTLNDVIDKLDIDDVGALVVTRRPQRDPRHHHRARHRAGPQGTRAQRGRPAFG